MLPDFNTAGYWASALLVLLRLMQGLSAGAETAGASALSTEEAPEGRRGFFASFAMSGISAGIVLASLAFLPVAAMSEADRPAWFSELFNVKVRYSGMAIGLQVGILCAGFTPLLGTALVGADMANWAPAAWIVAASSVLAVAGAAGPRDQQDSPARPGQSSELSQTQPLRKQERTTAGTSRRRPLTAASGPGRPSVWNGSGATG